MKETENSQRWNRFNGSTIVEGVANPAKESERRMINVPIQKTRHAIIQDQITEMAVADAVRQQREKDAAIVRSFQFEAGHQYDQRDIDEQKEQCAKEIESQ